MPVHGDGMLKMIDCFNSAVKINLQDDRKNSGHLQESRRFHGISVLSDRYFIWVLKK
jgi:hypothetical protein